MRGRTGIQRQRDLALEGFESSRSLRDARAVGSLTRISVGPNRGRRSVGVLDISTRSSSVGTLLTSPPRESQRRAPWSRLRARERRTMASTCRRTWTRTWICRTVTEPGARADAGGGLRAPIVERARPPLARGRDVFRNVRSTRSWSSAPADRASEMRRVHATLRSGATSTLSTSREGSESH